MAAATQRSRPSARQSRQRRPMARAAGILARRRLTSAAGRGCGAVNTLVVSSGLVYLGGSFSTVGGQPRGHVAAVDATSGAVTGWNPQSSAEVVTILPHGSTIYVGGAFNAIGGQARSHIAAL